MASSESPSIIEEYSQTFTSLQAGKKELIQWGAEAVALNRFIIDSADETGETDTQSVLQAIDISQVPHGDNEKERYEYCDNALKKLISLQEEVSVLQKSAREKGISGGLLTIIGQAANQSPGDNGASVLRQLSELVGGDPDNTTQSGAVQATTEQSSPNQSRTDQSRTDLKNKKTEDAAAISLAENAANDIDRFDLERMTGMQLAAHTLREHWKPLVIDASVCAVAASIAISLIN